jgi:uncharacterized membrane protein
VEQAQEQNIIESNLSEIAKKKAQDLQIKLEKEKSEKIKKEKLEKFLLKKDKKSDKVPEKTNNGIKSK